jgi:ABC-2 type transport system ATP-binding protein
VIERHVGEVHLEPDPAKLSTSCAEPERAAEAIAQLSRADIGVGDFSLGQPSLDEVFLALTGHPAEEETAQEEAVEEEQLA